MEENNKTINQEFYNQHKYDINIIDIYIKLVDKFKLIAKDENSSLIIDRYKNVITHLIEFNGYEPKIFFKLNLPYTLYCYDNSYDLFFALKFITLEEYLIEPLLNFQYQYSPDKDLFVNRLEFYVLENIENNNYFDNTIVKESVVNWIVKKRATHNHEYTNINNPLHLSPLLTKKQIKKSYAYPDQMGAIEKNELFRLFKTELYFDTFLKTLIEQKIIDNKCKWIVKNDKSKVVIKFLSIEGYKILDDNKRYIIAEAIIDFFNLDYSVETARKDYTKNDSNNKLYNSLDKVIKELTTDKEK